MSDRVPISPKSPRAALEPEQVPPPPKRSKRARSPFVVAGNAIITIILLLMISVGSVYVWGKQKIETPGPLKEEKIVNIPSHASIGEIADILQHEGVIDNNRWIFFGGVIAMKARSELKSGEYAFQKNASMRDVINVIIDGKVVQHIFTIPEGLTSEQVIARLLENDVLAGQIKDMPREGSLLPETYKFPRGTLRDQVIQRMKQTQARVLAEVWERRSPDAPFKSPEQLVTLASIIEKETGRVDERSRVAAVFTNRLRQKIKLQSDPTIIYGLVGGKGTLGRPIKRSEILQPSPYNTYVIDGLPPGPIANPGRASLEAAANPARTRDLFFVADGSGGHLFSENYSQHQKNVAKLRLIERQQQNDTVELADDPQPTSASGDTVPDAVEQSVVGGKKTGGGANRAVSAKSRTAPAEIPVEPVEQ